MTDAEVTKVITDYIRQVIEDIGKAHFSRRRPLNSDEHDRALDVIDSLLSDNREAIAKGDWRHGQRTAEMAFEHAGKTLEEASEDYPLACSVGLKVGIAALEYEKSLLLGNTGSVTDSLSRELISGYTAPTTN